MLDTKQIAISGHKNEGGKEGKSTSGTSSCSQSMSSLAAGIQNVASATVHASSSKTNDNNQVVIDTVDSTEKLDLRDNSATNNRHSNESGTYCFMLLLVDFVFLLFFF